jgi:hypothetical protein
VRSAAQKAEIAQAVEFGVAGQGGSVHGGIIAVYKYSCPPDTLAPCGSP